MSKNSSIAIVAGVAIAVAVIASVFAFSAISNDSAPMDVPDEVTQVNIVPPEEKITVLTSFYPYHEFTKNVAGDFAEVKQFMPAGVEAHDWEPRAQEIQSLLRADVFVYNGLGMESYVDQIMESGEFDNVLFVKASEGVELLAFEDTHNDSHGEEFYEEIADVIEEFEHGHITESQSIEAIEEILHEHEGDGHGHGTGAIEDIENLLHEIEDGHIEGSHGLEEIHHLVSGEDVHGEHEKEDEHDGHDHGGQDPHIWLNPVYAQLQAKNIANALSNSDPTNKNYYQSNAEMYIKELDLLDSKIRTDLSGCRTDFITFHNAFSYFAEEYGLTQHTIVASTDPHGDVTPKTLEKIISTAKKLNIKVIFAEESTSTKTSQVIADEIGGKVLVLSPLEVVSDEEDYVSKMTQNLENLREALC